MRFADGYRKGLDGEEAAWATKKFRGHRVLPPTQELKEALAARKLAS